MKNQQFEDVTCKGRMPETRQKCEAVIYQSDGNFLKMDGKTVNPDMKIQRIVCDRCGYTMIWKRNDKFLHKDSPSRREKPRPFQSNFNRSDKT